MQLEKLIEKDKQLFSEYKTNFYTKFWAHLQTGTSGIRNNADYLDYACWRTSIFLAQVARLDCSKVLGFQQQILTILLKALLSQHHITLSKTMEQNVQIFQVKCLELNSKSFYKKINQFFVYRVQNVFIKEENLEKGLEYIQKEILRIGKKDKFEEKVPGHIYLGCDTRVSSPRLSSLAQEAIVLSGNCCHFFGEVTTPQLHHFVYIFNSPKYNKGHSNYQFDTDVEKIKNDYYNYYAGTFLEILKTINITSKCKQFEKIYIDCSNGVGGVRVPQLFEQLKHIYDIEAVNDKDTENLNVDCGAEFVQKERQFCTFGKEKLQQCHQENKVGAHFASFDGDSDRIVFFYSRKENPEKIIILDGDFIMTLLTQQAVLLLNDIKDLIKKFKDSQILVYSKSEPEKWIIGNGLTGYTNGSCFSYLENKLGSQVKLSANGVKNLHHTCLNFDIGVYFEANGHGTIAINNGRLEELEEFSDALNTLQSNIPEQQKADFTQLQLKVKQLALYLKLSNQAVGDAISDFLLVEAALLLQNLTMESWFNLYKELPNKTSKVVIKNRFAISVDKLQTTIIKPKEVQDAIDQEVKKVVKGRGFARPSGTEDIVRIYVEAESEEDVVELEKKIVKIISENKEIN